MENKNIMVEDIIRTEMFADITPLERAVGFSVAEETYDLLSFREQVIIDLLCAGFTHAEIGEIFDVSQPSISSSVRRMRLKLAGSKLKMILDARELFREGR